MEERWTMMADLWSRLGGIAEKEGHRQAHIHFWILDVVGVVDLNLEH